MTTLADITSKSKRPLPKGWQWVRIRDVCVNDTGVRDPRRHPDLSFKYVDITGVDNISKRITEYRSIFGRDAPSRVALVKVMPYCRVELLE